MVVVAQLVRAPDCGSGGPPFEPGRWYHSSFSGFVDRDALAQGAGKLVVDQDAVVVGYDGPPAFANGQCRGGHAFGQRDLGGHCRSGLIEADDNQGDNH